MTALWRHAHGALALDRCLVMAVVNVTPDSFSDGGRWLRKDAAGVATPALIEQCRRWREQGADLLDVGGESTRPGAEPVEIRSELARVIPVIEALRDDAELRGVALSVDTRRAEVAARALAAGAAIVNDVSGLADPEMATVVAEAGAGLVIGHMRGVPRSMQAQVRFDALFTELADELAQALQRAEAAGVSRDRIVLDPGVGFGKTAAQSAALVGASAWLREHLGCPVMIGASRKRFLAPLCGDKPAAERGLASVVAAVIAARHGAAAVRVHDVAQTVEALRVAAELESQLAAELARTC